MRFIGVGDNVVDRYVDERVMFPGGNTVNFAVFVGELNEDSSYMGVLAGDREGLLIKESLEKKGVDTSPCTVRENCGTERCDVRLVDGDRVFMGSNCGGGSHEDLALGAEQLKLLENYNVIHSSCYSNLEEDMVKLRDHEAIKTFDFSEEEAFREDEYLKKVCPYIDLALFSGTGGSYEQAEDLKNRCLELGTPMILITKGRDGQVLFTGEKMYEGRVREVEARDTMGAGDSFFAAFVVTLIRNGWSKGTAPEDKAVLKAFEVAADFSAGNCLREGAFGFATKY